MWWNSREISQSMDWIDLLPASASIELGNNPRSIELFRNSHATWRMSDSHWMQLDWLLAPAPPVHSKMCDVNNSNWIQIACGMAIESLRLVRKKIIAYRAKNHSFEFRLHCLWLRSNRPDDCFLALSLCNVHQFWNFIRPFFVWSGAPECIHTSIDWMLVCWVIRSTCEFFNIKIDTWLRCVIVHTFFLLNTSKCSM